MLRKFFDRIANQVKSCWIFFQMDYLSVFYDILKNKEFRHDPKYTLLKEVLTRIVGEFFEAMKVNRLLAVESLFRFQSRDQKENILNNYE
jgi:hypothetical protein